MEVERLGIPDLVLLAPPRFTDERGFFMESFNARRFAEAAGEGYRFVQDNHSLSHRRVLRGLHYQLPPHAQGKLVRVIGGAVFDVAVDIRRSSPTFGRWEAVTLSAENGRQFWIPPGFAHGFLTLSDEAEVLYKTTDYYAPECERSIIWNDPDLAIAWPAEHLPLVSPKDEAGVSFTAADLFP